MSAPLLYVALLALTVLIGGVLYFLVRCDDVLDRILGVDTIGVLLCGLLAVLSYLTRSPHYLDAALVFALLAFTGTLAATRSVERRGSSSEEERR